jgi:hypothetical protein
MTSDYSEKCFDRNKANSIECNRFRMSCAMFHTMIGDISKKCPFFRVEL